MKTKIKWKPVVGYDGLYEVSNYGVVKSLERFRKGKKDSLCFVKEKILKQKVDKYGYAVYGLSKDGKTKTIQANIIVAKAFPEICGKWFEGCETHHINNNSLDNRPENIIVVSNKEHSFIHSVEKSKPVVQIDSSGKVINVYNSAADVEKQLGICHSDVTKCCKSRTAGGFKWMYLSDFQSLTTNPTKP